MAAPRRPNSSWGIEPLPNRALERSRDGDVYRTPAISIYDIDYAILWWLQNKLALQITDNENIIKVPVMYGSGEKWSQVQENGYLRDVNGKIQVPLIVIRRTRLEKDSRIAQLDVEHDDHQRIKVLRIAADRQRNAGRDYFSKVYNAEKPQEFFLMAVPSFVVVTYEVILWTDYVEQMNHLIAEIEPTDGWAWGDTWKFPTRLSGYDTQTIVSDNEDRIVKTTMELTTYGMILNEFERKISNIEKSYSLKRISFNNERSQFAGYVDNLPEDMYPDNKTLLSQFNSIINRKIK